MQKIPESLTNALSCVLMLQQEVVSFRKKSFIHSIATDKDSWSFQFYFESDLSQKLKGSVFQVSNQNGFIHIEKLKKEKLTEKDLKEENQLSASLRAVHLRKNTDLCKLIDCFDTNLIEKPFMLSLEDQESCFIVKSFSSKGFCASIQK